jgi:hypothetical protein
LWLVPKKAKQKKIPFFYSQIPQEKNNLIKQKENEE